MATYPLPPWISQPAEPAQFYGQGLQIGVRIGEEQAQQRFAEQQMLRAQQQSAFEQQYQIAKLNLAVEAATRKQRAVSEYQSLLQQGIPAEQALMRVGPGMGENMADLLRVQQMGQQQAAQLAETTRYHSGQLARRSPALMEAQDLANLKDQLSALPPEDPNRQRLQTMIDAMEARHGMEEITVGPEGTKIVKGVRRASGDILTPANTTKAQSSLNQALMGISVADRLMPLITDETVGPKAFVEHWVNDRFLANWFPGLASEKRATAERLAAEHRAAIVHQLRSDTNIAVSERNELLKSVPEINDPIDSPARARASLQASRRLSGMFSFMLAKTLRQPVDPAALGAIEDTDLVTMVKSRLITEQEAKELWQAKRRR